MRGLRSTIALLVVLIGLGAYIYFVTWKQPESADASSKQEKVFASLEADKIQELKIKSEKGDTSTIVKKDGTWQLTQPLAARADESEVSGITSGLSFLCFLRGFFALALPSPDVLSLPSRTATAWRWATCPMWP